jgi:phenylacetate-CoA ligase
LYTSKGAKINGGNVSNILKYLPNAVIRSQFIQNSFSEITLLLEIDKKLYKDNYDQLIQKEFVSKFGLETKLIIKHVDEIPREKSGKFRMIKNNVENLSD